MSSEMIYFIKFRKSSQTITFIIIQKRKYKNTKNKRETSQTAQRLFTLLRGRKILCCFTGIINLNYIYFIKSLCVVQPFSLPRGLSFKVQPGVIARVIPAPRGPLLRDLKDHFTLNRREYMQKDVVPNFVKSKTLARKCVNRDCL